MLFAKEPKLRQRTRHIDTRYHWIKDLINFGKLRLLWVKSEHNLADFLTKFMTKAEFMRNIERIMEVILIKKESKKETVKFIIYKECDKNPYSALLEEGEIIE
jgi:hypothetical protein